MPHSAVIISQQAQQSNNVSIPAFTGAETPQPDQGISMGAVAHFSFRASKSGVYAIACGVSGHDADGMWDTLVVSAAAKAPTVKQGEEYTPIRTPILKRSPLAGIRKMVRQTTGMVPFVS